MAPPDSEASAAAAKLVATRHITSNDRVLLLGASGGVGTFLCQYAKRIQNCKFLAATTTQADMVKSLGVDRVIDYGDQFRAMIFANQISLQSQYQNIIDDLVAVLHKIIVLESIDAL